MMICPVCNSFQSIEKNCPYCKQTLQDGGRMGDYLDPYNHYLDIDIVKLADGYENSIKNNECPHLLYCPHCGYDEMITVREQ